MQGSRIILALAGTLALAACGSDSTGPSDWETISGSYAGAMAGLTQGVALEATFSLTLTQNRGDLGGSYALQGVLTDGIDHVDVQGTGTVTGSVARGTNPSVNVSVTPGFCPNRTASFSGAYDSANRRITLTGPVQFFDANCQPVLTYQMTFILNR